MNLQRFKRCSALHLEAPPFGNSAGLGRNGRTATCTEARNSNPSGVKASNRVSQYIFRMMALIAVLFAGAILSIGYAATTKPEFTLRGITPDPDIESGIDSFEFDLDFDISNVISEYGEDPLYGISVVGSSTSDRAIYLYQGDVETGTLIGKIFDYAMTGRHSDFKTGNTVHISFPNVSPIDGQQYTLKISSVFSVQKSGASTTYSTALNYSNAPLIYTFVGKSTSSVFSFKEWLTKEDIKSDILTPIEIGFTKPISISSSSSVVLREASNSAIYASGSIKVSESNSNIAVIDFGDTKLRKGHSYELVVEAGSICDAEDTTKTNFELKYPNTIEGTYVEYFSIESFNVKKSWYGLINGLDINFNVDIPEVGGISPNTLDIVNENGEKVATATRTALAIPTQSYTINSSLLKPSTKYRIICNEGDLYGVISLNGEPSIINKPFTIEFTTPSYEEIDVPSIEFQTIGLSEHNYRENGLENGYTTAKAGVLEIACKEYQFDGKEYDSVALRHGENESWSYGQLYEVTDNGDVFVKNFTLNVAKRGTNGLYLYPVVVCNVNEKLLEGKTYRLVIPENTVYVNTPYEQYIRSPRYEFLMTGTSPVAVKLLGCNIKNESKLKELGWVIWEYDGAMTVADGAKAKIQIPGSNGYSDVPLTVYNPVNATTTFIKADFSDSKTGKLKQLLEGRQYDITIPAGAIHYASDPDIKSGDLKLTVYGAPEEVATADMVNLTLNVNGVHSSSHKAVKGEPYAFSLSHDNNWIVESVTHNGKNVSASNGTYTTEPLSEAENNIEANLKFAHEITNVDFTTGIDGVTVEGSDISVGKEGDSVLVSGLRGGEHICVYAMNGILVHESYVGINMDSTRITLPSNSVLIILVESADEKQAFKIKL